MNHNYCLKAVDFAGMLGSSCVSLHYISTGARYLVLGPPPLLFHLQVVLVCSNRPMTFANFFLLFLSISMFRQFLATNSHGYFLWRLTTVLNAGTATNCDALETCISFVSSWGTLWQDRKVLTERFFLCFYVKTRAIFLHLLSGTEHWRFVLQKVLPICIYICYRC
jgi:hypothetical protein